DGVFTLGMDDGTHVEPAYSGALPSEFRLEQNNPNPFNPNTTIRFSLPEPSRVTLTIYNIRGQLVRSLLAEQDYPAGYHQVPWDSRDEHGLSVASGVYFYTLKAGGFFATRKLVLMR
ncbi:T9SS C-terminal target domain-containing protein, partial [candidate division KSB1 bacterium]|nr:T9SS C-terminal target domain-containing protein [candidate division KSB1 bacterium]